MIDVKGTLARLGDDRELLRDTARFAVEDVPRLLKDVERGFHDGDAEAAVRAVHSLKGLALNFGAEDAVKSAASVESDVGNADLAAAADRLGQLRSDFEALTCDVRREVLEESDPPGRPDVERPHQTHEREDAASHHPGDRSQTSSEIPRRDRQRPPVASEN